MKAWSGCVQNNTTDSLEALLGQVADEFTEQVRNGKHPEIEEYAARYPQIAVVLRQVLPALQVMGDPAAESLAAGEAADPLAALRGCLGDFHILREIGRGGMGIVYEAEQLSLSRRVALKILPFAAALDPKQLQRFKNEAQAAAHLHHTNIVPVFGVGCERGVHYYAMQFIEGRTLAAVVAELRQQSGLEGRDPNEALSPVAQDLVSGRWAPVKRAKGEGPPTTPYMPREPTPAPLGDTAPRAGLSTDCSITNAAYLRTVANLGAQAAEALEHAHQLGVVHRDIKPANLLVDVRGNLWITDFGLAHCQSQAGLTMTGDLVGTLRYMSPEQALAKRLLIDHRTDIYSLGVTLYELLTLEPAFSGHDREELLQQIAFREPPAPRLRNKAIPRELETIVLKAIEKSPEARYPTAQELADDLRRFLEYKPIRAKRPTLVQRASKWCRRNPLLAGALTAVVATLGLGTVVAWLLVIWALTEQGRAKDKAAEAATQWIAAQRAEEKAARQLYAASLLMMPHAWENHNILDLQDRLAETADFPDRGFEWYYWQRRCHVESLLLAGHTGGVTAVAFAPDSPRLATGGKDGTVRIWDANTGQEQFCLQGHQNEVTGVAFAPGGQWLVSSSTDGTARIWDAAADRQLRILRRPNNSPVWAVAVTPDGRQVITGHEDSTATVWDAATGQERLCLNGQPALPVLGASTVGLLSSPQAQASVIAASALYPGRTRHTGPVWAVAVTLDGKRLVTGGQDNLLMLWDAASGRQVRTFLGHEPLDRGGINSIAATPDGKRLITAGNDNSARVWDIDTGRELFAVHRNEGWEVSIAVTPDGQRLMVGSTVWELVHLPDIGASTVGLLSSPAATVSLLAAAALYPGRTDTMGGREVLTLRGHRGTVTCVAVSPDGQRLATASWDGTARVWNPFHGPRTQTLRGHTENVWSVAMPPDGQRIISGSRDCMAKVWDTASGHELFSLQGHTGSVFSIVVTPDGQRIITAGEDGMVRVWDAASGRELFTLRHADVPVFGASTVGLLGSSHAQGPLLAASALYPRRMGHTGHIRCIAVSPDGQRLVVGRWGLVQLWDLGSRREILTLEGHAGVVKARAVAVTPDGQRVVTGSWDGRTILWDITDGREILTVQETTGGVTAVAVTPDNQRLIIGRSDGTVTVWDAVRDQKLFSLRGSTDTVTSIAVTADGQRIVTASIDGVVRLWDAVNGRELLALKGDGGPVRSVAVTPDGRRIVTGNEDGTVTIWKAATPAQVARWTEQDQKAERAWEVWHDPVRGAPGFIQDWLVLAPLALDETQRAAQGVEREQLRREASLKPREGDFVPVGDGQRTWRAHHAEEPVLDFNRFVGKMCPDSVAYAVCYVISAVERHDLLLQVGSDDEAKVYLNGQEIYKYTRVRGGGLDPSRRVTLRQGTNVLVLKVVNEKGEWLACARFVDRDGNPVPGLEVRLTPE